MKLLISDYFYRSCLCLFFCMFTTVLYAASGFDTLAITNKNVYAIQDYLYWTHTENKLPAATAYQLLEKGSGRKLAPDISINSGFTSHYYWMTFTLKNVSATEKHLFYKFNYPFLNHIEVYKQSFSGFERILKTGAELPFYTRGYAYHDFVLPVSLDKGETASFLIMAERIGERFSTTPELISAESFKKEEQFLYVVIGIIVGIMVFNIAINVFLAISLGDRIHYLYSAYVIGALIWVFSSTGTDYQFLYPGYPAVFNVSQFSAGAVTMILMAQLAIVFLELKNNGIKSYYLLNTFKWLLVFALIFRIGFYIIFSDQLVINKVVSNVYMATIAGIAVAIMWAAAKRIGQGFKPAWFYLAAICFLAVSILKTCYVILMTNDLSELVSPPTSIQLGLIIESLIIFAGIIYRYSIFKRERKELALKLADQKLAMAQNIVSAQEEERKRLAQDLHDDLGATLSTLLLHITNQTDNVTDNQFNERSIAITQKALADLRNISHDLLPKDFSKIYLFQVLRNRIDELRNTVSTRFWLNVDGDDQLLSEIQSVTFYRIINELINNTIKHAKAAQSNIELIITEGNMMLIFEDNGIGMMHINHQNGIGIKNIYSRVAFLNGKINIDYNNQGTTIIIVAPL